MLVKVEMGAEVIFPVVVLGLTVVGEMRSPMIDETVWRREFLCVHARLYLELIENAMLE